jgi:hypothetical protein
LAIKLLGKPEARPSVFLQILPGTGRKTTSDFKAVNFRVPMVVPEVLATLINSYILFLSDCHEDVHEKLGTELALSQIVRMITLFFCHPQSLTIAQTSPSCSRSQRERERERARQREPGAD